MKKYLTLLLLATLVSCTKKLQIIKGEVPMFYTTKDCKIILIKTDNVKTTKGKVIFLRKHNHKIY